MGIVYLLEALLSVKRTIIIVPIFVLHKNIIGSPKKKLSVICMLNLNYNTQQIIYHKPKFTYFKKKKKKPKFKIQSFLKIIS